MRPVLILTVNNVTCHYSFTNSSHRLYRINLLSTLVFKSLNLFMCLKAYILYHFFKGYTSYFACLENKIVNIGKIPVKNLLSTFKLPPTIFNIFVRRLRYFQKPVDLFM